MSTETLQKLEEARQRLEAMSNAVNLEEREKRLGELEKEMQKPEFWQDKGRAQAVNEEMRKIRQETEPLRKLLKGVVDLAELVEMASSEGDEATLAEVKSECDTLLPEVDKIELMTTLGGTHDKSGAYLSVHAGAGGTESCDWASILMRMYTRWAEDNGYKASLVDELRAEEAGIKNATLKISGDYAYGYLKSEIGVHRLVRISPFDAKSRRHTSFASVDVTPELPDDIDVAIDPSDLRVDTYRASGAGGQHVNKTESAIRVTHIPSGIVVQCQNERSQHSNRAQAMRVLKSRLIQLEEAKREEALAKMYSEKGEIAWGNQIRSYVLQPYTMVKDHRTKHEMGNAQGALDGKIQGFMDAYLHWRRSEGN